MRRKTTVSDDDLIRDIGGRHLTEPSRRVLAEAIALGGRLTPARKGVVSWVAELLFDSGLAPATVGVRNGAAASERRLLYSCRAGAADEAQIDLRLRAAADGSVEMFGQILPPWRDANVEVKVGRTRRQTSLGTNGEFSVAGLPGGPESMVLAFRATNGRTLVLDRVPMPGRKGRPAAR